jgi:hypothetical protein
VSRFFSVKCHEIRHPLFHHFCRPKISQAQIGFHDLRARSFEDGCLCSILHGLLQLQIWTAFLLPARLFPTTARQSATQLSHTTFSQLSEPTQGSPSTCTLLFPFTARFSALHCSPHLHKWAVVTLTPQTPPSPLMRGFFQAAMAVAGRFAASAMLRAADRCT